MCVAACADEQLDAAYSEIQSVISVGRGIGLWGDMVITLRNGDKIELRSLPGCARCMTCTPDSDPLWT